MPAYHANSKRTAAYAKSQASTCTIALSAKKRSRCRISRRKADPVVSAHCGINALGTFPLGHSNPGQGAVHAFQLFAKTGCFLPFRRFYKLHAATRKPAAKLRAEKPAHYHPHFAALTFAAICASFLRLVPVVVSSIRAVKPLAEAIVELQTEATPPA